MKGARTNNDSATKPAETYKGCDLDVTAVLELVSDRYLMNDERFRDAKLAIAKSYKDVINSLADKSMLPLLPNHLSNSVYAVKKIQDRTRISPGSLL
jgi:hypothetical protein